MSAKIDLPINKIVEKFKQGVSMRELGREYKVSQPTIKRCLSEYQGKKKKAPSDIIVTEMLESTIALYKVGRVEKIVALHKKAADVLNDVLSSLTHDSILELDAEKRARVGKDVAVICNILTQQERYYGGGVESTADMLTKAAQSAMEAAKKAWSEDLIDVTPTDSNDYSLVTQ